MYKKKIMVIQLRTENITLKLVFLTETQRVMYN